MPFQPIKQDGLFVCLFQRKPGKLVLKCFWKIKHIKISLTRHLKNNNEVVVALIVIKIREKYEIKICC